MPAPERRTARAHRRDRAQDGLTEARHGGKLFGLDAVSAALTDLHRPSPKEAVAVLRARAAEFA
jgi:hypothetical protein